MNVLKFYKCMADDTRLSATLLIHKYEELCVCELTEGLDVIQPKMSRHLAQLKKCGVLTDRRQGTWIFYRVNPDLDSWAKHIIETTLLENEDYIAEGVTKIEHMSNRPDREGRCS